MNESLRKHGWYFFYKRYSFAIFALALLSACFLLSTPFSTSALTTVPTKMNFQGRLTDSAGNIKPNGTYNMKLRLYTASSGGGAVWTEDRLVSASQGVTVTNGLFSIKLGDVTSLPANLFASGELYLEVELPTPASATSSSPVWTEGPMTPRNQMATSAYAYNAETLDGLDSSVFGQLGANNIFTGANTINVASAAAFDVQNGSAVSVFKVDTTTSAVTIAANTTLTTGKTLTITGDTFANRPVSPTEGMIYYDQTTDQLLTYANGKWQADRTEAVIVAASNSSQANKDAADYVADGNGGGAADGDQVQINAALTAASGKKVVLLAGTYVADATILIPNNTTLAGVGSGTLVELADLDAEDNLIENTDTTTGTGIVIRDFRIDGRSDLNTLGNQRGIYLNGMGGGSGATARQGAKISGLTINNFRHWGVSLSATSINNAITDSIFRYDYGAYTSAGAFNTFTGNVLHDNLFGLGIYGQSNTVSSNTIQGTTDYDIQVFEGSYSTVTGNTIYGAANEGVIIDSSHVTVSGNAIFGSYDGIVSFGSHNTITGNTIVNTTYSGIFLSEAISNTITGNTIRNSGGSTDNNAIHLTAVSTGSDSNTITGNNITDSSATTTNYAINIDASTSGTNYLADNTLGGGSINDAGTGTIYANQVDASGNLRLQPAGTVELQKNTNVTGTLQATGNITASSGTVTIGTTSVAGNLVISDGSSNTATIAVGSLGGNYTYTIPVTTANDTFCLLTLANCASGGGVSTVGALDGGTANANGATILGSTLYLQSASATNAGLVNTSTQTFAGNKTFSGDLAVQNVSLAAGKTVTITGDTTANRPGSPTEGMIYFDTSTKQLLTYSNGKWQADRSTATKIIAPNNAGDAAKASADVVLSGTADQTLINTALTAAAGGKVYLMEGTISITGSISIPNNTTLAGSGVSTLITIPSGQSSSYYAVTNADTTTGTGVTIQDLRLDGNKANQSAGSMRGIYLDGMGSGSGASAVRGAKIVNVSSNNWYGPTTNAGIYLNNSSNNSITESTTQGNGSQGIYLNNSSNNTLIGNVSNGNSRSGIRMVSSSNNTINGNTTQGNTLEGIDLNSGSNNTVTGNVTQSNGSSGISVAGSNNTISGNQIYDNGGAVTNNGIFLSGADSNTIVGNSINDTSATTNNYAINVSDSTSDTNYLASNTLGGGSVNDLGTGTIYANQLNSSNQFISRSTGGFAIQGTAGTNLFSTAGTASVTIGTSDTTGTVFVLDTKTDAGDPTGIAGGMYYNSNAGKFRCYENGAWKDCVGGGLATNNTWTGTQTINVSSTAAFDVQNGSAVSVFKVDSSTSTVTLGTATNGSVFTSSGVIYVGTARPTRTITLAPEYSGATFTADGSNNNGSLSSDFCSSSSLLNINAAACPSAADEHNYYAWTTTQGTAQDYDLYVRYQIPSDYDTGSMTNMKLTAMGTLGANEIASLALHKGSATACGTITDAISSNATWATSTEASPLGACTIAAGDMVTFKIKLTAVSSGVARAGTISFDYRSKF